MTDAVALAEDLLILVLASLLPALIYLSWVRKNERYQTEAWGPLLGSFAYGALFATFVAAIIEVLILAAGASAQSLVPGPEFIFLNPNSPPGTLFAVLVVAPVIEEGLKASGVVRAASKFRMLSDGPVFGASVGLGFGFFETFLYGVGSFVTGGLAVALGLILVRSVSSVLLHGSTTGMFGYGYAKGRFGVAGSGAGAYYLLAVVMHGSFNLLASLSVIAPLLGYGQYADVASLVGLLTAILFAYLAIEHVRGLVRSSNFPGARAVHPKFRPPPIQRGPVGPARRP